MAVRTYARRGQTPVLRVKLTRDHLAAISGITPDGRLFMQVQDHTYRSEDVVRFLRLRLAEDHRQAPGHLGWSTDSSGASDQRAVLQILMMKSDSVFWCFLLSLSRYPKQAGNKLNLV
jgi:hypothetical protein